MPSMQRVIVVGHLGKDPELRHTPSGASVANFSIATSKRWKGKDGELHEKTTWFRVVAWNKTGEFAAQYLRKGQLVYVEGEIEERSWEDQSGNKRFAWELIATRVENLSPRSKEEREEPTNENEEDNIPF